MSHFRRINKRDDKTVLSEEASRHEALLSEALEMARRIAESKPQLVRDILATGIVEGLASNLDSKAAALTFRAAKYKRTWHTLIPWQYLRSTSAEEQAESIVQTVEENIQMTESNSWPRLPEEEQGAKEAE